MTSVSWFLAWHFSRMGGVLLLIWICLQCQQEMKNNVWTKRLFLWLALILLAGSLCAFLAYLGCFQ